MLSAAPARAGVTSAASFERRAATVHSFRDLHVVGNVSLRSFAPHGLVCHGCRFAGSLTGRGATFLGSLDLSGSTITGDLDVANASFDRTVDLRRAVVGGRGDFAGTDFRDLALFGSAPGRSDSFGKSATFALSTFDRLATFENGRFGDRLDFTLARFGSDAIFSGAQITGRATFSRTAFGGVADFSYAEFNDTADFTASSYADAADFGQAKFLSAAVLDRTRFAHGVSFIGALFSGDSSFESANAVGGFDFDLAEFDGPSDFRYAVSAPLTKFTSLTLDRGVQLRFDDTSFAGLEMDVGSVVRHVSDAGVRYRQHVLGVLETSAKAEGDLSQANAALYARQVLRSRHYPWYVRAPDFVFYRVAAGYFVRPFNPLATLLAIAAAFALVRASTVRTSTRPEVEAAAHVHPRSEPRRAPRASGALRRFPAEWWRTLASVTPRKDDAVPRVEVFAYRVLLACALIGFANSNPTLRQMFDAIH